MAYRWGLTITMSLSRRACGPIWQLSYKSCPAADLTAMDTQQNPLIS